MKYCLIFVLIIIVCLPMAGCYDAIEIDEEVYTLAIGVDKGVNNMIRVTFQYATYKEGGAGAKKAAEERVGEMRSPAR